jgi:hypothetical protein
MTHRSATTSMTTRTCAARLKPARSVYVHVLVHPKNLAPGAVELTTGKTTGRYLIVEIAADHGRGFRVIKIVDGTVYHVNLDGLQRTCECRGFLLHGYCKHADTLATLVAAGRL